MAQYQGSYASGSAQAPATHRVNQWAVGFTLFAAIMMVVIGISHFIVGLSAVTDDDFYIVRENFALEFDVSAWGWTHMIGGILVAIAGIALMGGSMIARIVAIFIAAVSAVWSFYSIPYYPVWSILIIALNVAVIWALAAHGGELAGALSNKNESNT